jgi:hypothetical protein
MRMTNQYYEQLLMGILACISEENCSYRVLCPACDTLVLGCHMPLKVFE